MLAPDAFTGLQQGEGHVNFVGDRVIPGNRLGIDHRPIRAAHHYVNRVNVPDDDLARHDAVITAQNRW
tara:strand:+ start:494 stop:697 length:204 start_codon:yes stop_codon:yes gene_type:complete